ncbi:interferon-induced very large GTPase 1-like [Mauremys mutica]|uniref:interferon-induced very large GTPase 1-like n=1 Tax=Mauremys mutica TaxID=74926 RepID=UPI001D16B541|nr:interferon-induced very large GTPase 1-like [Mauremys mutica]
MGSVVHSYYNGANRLQDQAVEFKGRTQLSFQEISQGVVSLSLLNARLSDSGEYRCIIVDSHQGATGDVILQVAVLYTQPQLTVFYQSRDEIILQCKSKGGYPEAEITWQEVNGNQLKYSEQTAHLRTSEGTFEVQSNLSIRVQENTGLCCTVTLKVLQSHAKVCEKILVPQGDQIKKEEEEVLLQAESDRKGKSLQEFLEHLKMEKYQAKKLTLSNVLEINPEILRDGNCQALGEIPWHFLRKVMALNMMARSTRLGPAAPEDEEEQDTGNNVIPFEKIDSNVCANPLDVLCAVLCCSDRFLQREILFKMSMCQFALPLLLPALDTPKCMLMLWAMRDIVRKWTPHNLAESRGFREESLVLTSVPTVSFVRLGRCSLSKSKILNKVLSPPQQQHDFFIHQDMESGNVPRDIAEGLVEISWYFPGGRESSDPFQEPIAVINLRGDIECHRLQFSFLAEVSSAVFIFADCISEREYELLSSLKESTKYYFILNNQSGNSSETLGSLNTLTSLLKLSKSQLLVKDKTSNKAEFVKRLQSIIGNILSFSHKQVNMEDMAVIARELGIQVDEDCEECQHANACIEEITGEIKDVAEYKREMLKLQGDTWKNLAKVEKELCRMKKQMDVPPEKYKSQLQEKLLKLRTEQNNCDFSEGLIKFLDGTGNLPQMEKHYFLKGIKFRLDHITRCNLSTLRNLYKEKCQATDNPQQLAKVDQLFSASSLGVEHFMRELGQFYEAEQSMFKEGKMTESERKYTNLPGIAADLMLDGFPMELIDGDASNIPLQWVTDVLTELHAKLGGRSKMLVLTVLGVQSTGKSTLLNTMFGLQFAVSSGRCTRGAFMSLIKVAETLRPELGYDFILVIDTEGLKAPELAKLEDSYEHDNKLATLVVGLSDITIVNMAMENATEMKDILQIVVHAFLRMEETGHKPNCQFVHQNVSDVSAHEQNMRDRKHLLEHLNEMTKAAARMEKQPKELTFSDIMDYNLEEHNWYIPGLWHGVPPMAPVNMGYSERVSKLKKYLLQYTRSRSPNRNLKDIPQFIEWVKSLWNGVKHENFIFSFRNSLVAEAYNQLCLRYSEWEWELRKEMHLWICDQETAIQNQLPNELNLNHLKLETHSKLLCGEKRILECLEKYFESGVKNLHLIEKYREDFIKSTKGLKNELECYLFSKCEEAIVIQKGRHKIDNIQAKYRKTIEGKVVSLLEDCRNRNSRLSNMDLETEFETMWSNTLFSLDFSPSKQLQIHQDMQKQLKQSMSTRGSAINQMLQKAGPLMNCGIKSFTIRKEHFNFSRTKARDELFIHNCRTNTEKLVISLKDKCCSYVEEKVNSKVDYDETYCRELIHIIDERLKKEEVEQLCTSYSFEVDLKLHILGHAAHAFQKMHDDFIKENDPIQRLEKFKPQYFSIFRDLYLEKDASQQRARDFCEQCLKPALLDYVKNRLGIKIMDDILGNGQSIEYSSRTFFQFYLLKKLLEEMDFDNYVKYINNYEDFVKSEIWKDILYHYKKKEDLEALEKEILSIIIKKITEVLKNSRDERESTISDFVANFCRELQSDLVICKDSLEMILFQNTANIKQFSEDIEVFLSVLELNLSSEFKAVNTEKKLSVLQIKPQDELFRKVFGCGKQCPFCKVPCEAGGMAHKEHFASIHRPQGLAKLRDLSTERLEYSLCSSDVVSNAEFRHRDAEGKYHPYKDYHRYYPDWRIQPDSSIEASDYWKFVFKEFNHQFARKYKAKPADLPENWGKITKEQALESMKGVFNMK